MANDKWKIYLMQKKELKSCRTPVKTPAERTGFLWGIFYGLVPHTFCILFVIFSIIGATSGAVFMKKFLFVPHLFQYLILLSLFFATLSAIFYLRRNKLFSMAGIKKKWLYLVILYSTTMAINLLFIYWILPAAANIGKQDANVTAITQITNINDDNVQVIRMDQVGAGYKPNSFTIKKNVPVKWIITSKSQSCAASIFSKKLNISQELTPGENVIEFTPKNTGKISFSCFMGMYGGSFNVIP